MLSSCCIFSQPEDLDGTRISIMSRHTLNDGKTSDPRIIEGLTHDLHLPELAPSPKVVGAYYRDKIDFEELAKRYRTGLEVGKLQHLLSRIAVLSGERDVLVMCVEEVPDLCHRRIFLEVMQQKFVGLRVDLG